MTKERRRAVFRVAALRRTSALDVFTRNRQQKPGNRNGDRQETGGVLEYAA